MKRFFVTVVGIVLTIAIVLALLSHVHGSSAQDATVIANTADQPPASVEVIQSTDGRIADSETLQTLLHDTLESDKETHQINTNEYDELSELFYILEQDGLMSDNNRFYFDYNDEIVVVSRNMLI